MATFLRASHAPYKGRVLVFDVIAVWRPDVITLGYDQYTLRKALETYRNRTFVFECEVL